MQNPQRIENRVPDGYMTVSEFSRSIGLRGGGIYRELKRYGIHPRKHGKYRIITIDQADKYISNTELPHIKRVRERPHGWLTTQQAANIVGSSASVIWKAANNADIKAVRRGYTRYHDPDDVRRFAMTYKARALPGWVPITDHADRLGTDTQTATQWLERNGYEIRRYRHPVSQQITNHALQADLDAYEDARTNTPPDGWVPIVDLAKQHNFKVHYAQAFLRRRGEPVGKYRHPEKNQPTMFAPPQSIALYVAHRAK